MCLRVGVGLSLPLTSKLINQLNRARLAVPSCGSVCFYDVSGTCGWLLLLLLLWCMAGCLSNGCFLAQCLCRPPLLVLLLLWLLL